MKFREFLLRSLLKGTDYLVGYDASTGEYIRISKADLASSIAAIAAAQTLAVQYSANGSSWHDSYTAGDHCTRIKAGSGAWSAAIPLCVSAYDIWRQRNSGSEDDFIASLQGPAGAPADLSGVTIQNIEGYAEFLQQVHAEVANAKNAIVDEVTTEVSSAMEAALADKLDKDLSNLDAVTYMGNGAYIPIMTRSGMVKVSTEDLVAYIGIKSRVENSSIETTIKSQRETIAVTTVADGNTTRFSVQDYYTLGTSAVYLNGNRLYAGRDYVEVNSRTFEFIVWKPTSDDNILFEAIPLATTNPTQESQYAHDDQ